MDGIIVKSVHENELIADIERTIKFKDGMKYKNRSTFRPDVTVVNKKDEIIGIIEYETIDASTEHIEKKLNYFEYAMKTLKINIYNSLFFFQH